MFSPRDSEQWFGSESSESRSRPSTAQSFVTAKSSTTATSGRQAAATVGAAAGASGTSAVPPALSVMPALLTDLNRSDDPAAVGDAALHLCLLLDSVTEADEAAALGAAMRHAGARGLPRLLALLDDASRAPAVHQSCLLLLANLAAPDVDPRGEVLASLKALDVLSRLVRHVSSETEVQTVVYALGAIRNNVTTAEEATRLANTGTIATLQALANGARSAEDPNGRLRQYAAGCIINVRQIQHLD